MCVAMKNPQLLRSGGGRRRGKLRRIGGFQAGGLGQALAARHERLATRIVHILEADDLLELAVFEQLEVFASKTFHQLAAPERRPDLDLHQGGLGPKKRHPRPPDRSHRAAELLAPPGNRPRP